MSEEIENKLLAAGVRNLQEFGYPGCNKDNIITDDIYRAFFVSMLEESNGGKALEPAINSLLKRCAEAAIADKT